MIFKKLLFLILIFYNQSANALTDSTKINFSGENLPLDRIIVSKKLSSIIFLNKKNAPILQKISKRYFPYIEEMLRKHGIPDDFKYLPVIESSFLNASSHAGASGLWQFMPETAIDYGLNVSHAMDDRSSILKSTNAACKHILSLYKNLRSWTLTALAYNYGLGNVKKTIQKQGRDYYSMKLNQESGEYLYRIVAIKELFTRPEFYQNSFNLSPKITNNGSELKVITDNKPKFNQYSVEKIQTKNNKELLKGIIKSGQWIEKSSEVEITVMQTVAIDSIKINMGSKIKANIEFGPNLRIILNINDPVLNKLKKSIYIIDQSDNQLGIKNYSLKSKFLSYQDSHVILMISNSN